MSLLSNPLGKDPIDLTTQFYIRASSSLADESTLVLLDGDTLAVFDRSGDIQPLAAGPQGIFHQETRHVSRLEMRLSGEQPLLLSSALREDNVLFAVDLTNPDMRLASGLSLPRGTLHIFRTKLLKDGACYDKIAVHNYGDKAVDLEISFEFEADFADIFEVRGEKRARRGETFAQKIDRNAITLVYRGLDAVQRNTRIQCSLSACNTLEGGIVVPIHLQPQGETDFMLTIACQRGDPSVAIAGYDESLQRLTQQRTGGPLAEIDIQTSSEQFNQWVRRSQSDLAMLATPTESGLYPYAGVPWYSTVFGRDGIITALELLWILPSLARSVLMHLAATQAISLDTGRDAEPGKILHEMRKGEMSQLREVPFGRYYGSVDATPMFVVLAAAYFERTADIDFLRQIWPNILAALEWIDRYGDRDGDGFVEYTRQNKYGIAQQGWKDSSDSVFYTDGKLASGPIALCEVQSYVYAAKRGIAHVASALGDPHLADQLNSQAAELKWNFGTAFWSDQLSTFVIALDGDKRQCQIRSSNAGHCLFSDIATEAQHRSVSASLLSSAFFSGWGIRTLVTGEKRYNPMSYHNGSVWPHDNALIAYGALRSSDKKLALRVLSGLLDLSQEVNLHRLPELICGFSRRPGKGPTLYPVACSPQAWSAGAVFMILQACLGLEIRARESRIYLHYSALPKSLQHVQIRNLRVGNARVDLAFERYSETVGANILERTGDVEIVSLR